MNRTIPVAAIISIFAGAAAAARGTNPGDKTNEAASISKPVAAVVAPYFVETGLPDLDGDVNGKLRSWKAPENEFTRDEKITERTILRQADSECGTKRRGRPLFRQKGRHDV